MNVKIYCINANQTGQYYGLKSEEENTVLHAPNNWKTESGARRWAENHGFKIVE